MIALCKVLVISITNIKYIRLKFENFPDQAIFSLFPRKKILQKGFRKLKGKH